EWSDGAGNRPRHAGWRTRSVHAGRISGLPGEGKRGGDRAKSGGQLARRSPVCSEAGTGWLRVLPEADGRVRSAAASVSQAKGKPERRGEFAGREAKGAAQEEKEGEYATVRPAHRVVSPDRCGPDPDRRG